MAQRLTFQRSRRLTHAREYQAAYRAKVKKFAGPLVAWGRPNGLPHWRLGLSVGKRVGNATVRNLAKRMVREAFRLSQHDLPVTAEGGYDLVVSVRPHDPLTLEDYRRHLMTAAHGIHKEWQKRSSRREAGEQSREATSGDDVR